MKKSTLQLPNIALMLTWFLLVLMSCSDPMQDDSTRPDDLQNLKDDAWVQFLEQTFYDNSILVPKEGSIQQAIREAEPGQAIYIEPWIYKEDVNIDKPNIKLIGLATNNDKVVLQSSSGRSNSLTLAASDVEVLNIEYTLNNQTQVASRTPSHARSNTSGCKVTRKQKNSKIAHYEFEVRVGNGPYDVIRIHRVVREQRPFKPVKTDGAVFMLHGAALSFKSIFLAPGTDDINPETSSAYYLASKDIDVWGMDFGWTLTPVETTDFTFMKDWGVDRDIDHTLIGLAAARLIRGLTGQGLDKMNLLGFSYGVVVGYGAAGRETQQHKLLRDIKGLVAIDQVMKYNEADNESRQFVCNTATEAKNSIDNGIYETASGKTFAMFANLATTSPDDTSPVIPSLSNLQAALFVGTNSYLLGNPPAPSWHFVSGAFTNGVPTGLNYTNMDRWFNLMKSLPPYQPQKTVYEARLCACNEGGDVAFDDHLNKISVPILYIGAGGAFGTLGDYTATLTSSTDITSHIVTLNANRPFDFGHGELFVANDADDLVWKKLHSWLVAHNKYSVW